MRNNQSLIILNAALIVIITIAVHILSGMGYYTTDLEPGWTVHPGTTGVTITKSPKLAAIIYILIGLQIVLVASLVFYMLRRQR